MKKSSGVNYSKAGPVISRRKRVIQMLEHQLEINTKKTKLGDIVPLEVNDITRINKELAILKTKL